MPETIQPVLYCPNVLCGRTCHHFQPGDTIAPDQAPLLSDGRVGFHWLGGWGTAACYGSGNEPQPQRPLTY